MPDLFEEITQGLVDPRLDLIGMERSPHWIGNYRTSNQLVNALAHLVGTDGHFSRLVECDADGILPVRICNSVSKRLASVDNTGNLYVEVGGGGNRAAVMLPTSVDSGDYGLVVVCDALVNMEAILSDVYNAVDHALTTKEAV